MAIFNSYVKLPEGKSSIYTGALQFSIATVDCRRVFSLGSQLAFAYAPRLLGRISWFFYGDLSKKFHLKLLGNRCNPARIQGLTKSRGRYTYIYIYIYAQRLGYICPIHEQMMLQITIIPMGKITQILETIKQTRSKQPKFLWEKQKRHNTCNSYGKNNKGTNKF